MRFQLLNWQQITQLGKQRVLLVAARRMAPQGWL